MAKFSYKGYEIDMDYFTKRITCETPSDFITFYPAKFTSTLEEIKKEAFDKIDDRIKYLFKHYDGKREG